MGGNNRMTILNNMVRAYRYLLGTMPGISANRKPSGSPNFNDFYTIDAARLRLASQNSSSITTDGGSYMYAMFYPSNITDTTPGTSSGNFVNSAIVAITEDFSIVDNEYIVNNKSVNPISELCSRGASCSTTELKTTFSITYTNDTESSVSVYGFLMRGRISGWSYGTGWASSSSSYSCPMAVVKFDQPKVVEPGGVLQMSYTIDFSNLISEANEIVVTQQ